MIGGQWDGGDGQREDGQRGFERGDGQRGYAQHRRGRYGLIKHRLGLRWPLIGLGVTGAGVAAVVLVVAVGLGQTTGSQACAAVLAGNTGLAGNTVLTGNMADTGTVSGIATHYVLQGLPNCSYPSPPSDGLFVALSPSEYDSAAGCGGYLEVSGPDGSVRVQVIDQCPECATGHIDLSEPAFAKLAPLSAGLINVTYTYLTDPALPGPISIEVKQGSSQYWLALLADNTGNPLASVQVETPSGWVSLARANYNYWIAQSGAGQGPFTVRLTDTQGHQATVSGITLSPGAVQSTGTWMYGAGSAAAPAPSAPASSPPASSPPVPSARSSSAPSAPASSAAASAPSSSRAPATSSTAASSPSKRSPTAPAPSGSPSPAPTTAARTGAPSSSRPRPLGVLGDPPVPSAPDPSPRPSC